MLEMQSADERSPTVTLPEQSSTALMLLLPYIVEGQKYIAWLGYFQKLPHLFLKIPKCIKILKVAG